MSEDQRTSRSFARIEAIARDIGRAIASFLPKGVGFTLVVYTFGDGGEMTYLSNGNRSDVVKMLKEVLPIIEHGADAPPGAKGHPARQGGTPS